MRDQSALWRHYEIERDLADRLRRASRGERKDLYRTLYDELFSRIPDHPQNILKTDIVHRQNRINSQLRLLRHFLRPDDVYLEIGSGDCHLARAVAGVVGKVYAVDVSEVIAAGDGLPENFSMIISDGISIEVPKESVNVAYSNQLMEHLHPEDAVEQLEGIYRSLAPGGVYLCITPHRYSGPHDISGLFGDEPVGFHMKEYSYRDLSELFLRSGFAAVDMWAGVGGRFSRVPGWAVLGVEFALGALPRRARKPLAGAIPLRSLFGNAIVVGRKSPGCPS